MKFKAVLLIVITLFLYSPALKYFFFQDDFYTLVKSQAHSLADFLNFFMPGNEIYYRPLSMRLYFFLVQSVFGANPAVFHALSLLLHLVNSFLVWSLINRLTKNSWFGWVVGLLYATGSMHFISLYWIAEVGLLWGVFWYLLACHAFLGRNLKLLLIATIAGLLSHEYLVTLPASLLLLRRDTKPLALVSVLVIFYLILRLVIFPVKPVGTYSLILGKPTLKAAMWYGLWSLNLLENLNDQLEPGMKLNRIFLYDYPYLNLAYIATLIAAITLLIIGLTRKSSRGIILLGAVWSLINLAVPLATPLHLYPLYANLSLIGIALMLTASAWPRKLIISLIIGWWLTVSFHTLRLQENIHWTVQEAIRAGNAITASRQLYPTLPTDSTIVINQDYQIELALYGSLGLQYAYNDRTLTTHYGSIASIIPQGCTMESEPELKSCLSKHKIFELPL